MSCIRQGRPETQLWRPHWVVRHALNLIFGCHDPDMVLQFPGLSYTSISCLALLAGQKPPYHYLALSLQPGWVVSCNRGEKKNNRIAVKGTERNREINAGGRLVAFLKTISCNISTCAVALHCSSAVIRYICALFMCTAPIFISKILPKSFPFSPRFTTSSQSCSHLFANS